MGPEQRRMKGTLILVVSLVLSIRVDAQEKILEALIPELLVWSEGSVMLSDGSELKGMLKYNDRSGVLFYDNGKDQKTLTPRRVVAFEFSDEKQQLQRVFYSFPLKDDQNAEQHYFFEVIKQFKAFAVLSKIDPIEVETKDRGTGIHDPVTGFTPYYGRTTDVTQTETIYIMSERGAIKPYVRIVEKDIDGILFDSSRTKNRMLDEGLLERFAGKNYAELEAFAKKNRLSFKRKKDLIEILDYYEDLLAN